MVGMSRLLRFMIILLIIGVIVGLIDALLGGASAGSVPPGSINSGDTAWMIVASALVMIMTPAVGLFYGGMVKPKNLFALFNRPVMIMCIVAIQWVVLGYSLSFGNDIFGVIGGLNFVALNGVGFAPSPSYATTIPQLLYMVYEGMFAIITPALIIGAFAGRMKLKALVVFTIIWSTIVYDPIAHWVWGAGGWAHSLGILDFAGGSVVHASAGFAALAAVLVIGPRLGYKPHEEGPPPNDTYVLLGAAFLWFGWFGFNGGSAFAASPQAVNAFVTTNLAAAAGGLTWMFIDWAHAGRFTAISVTTGAVIGLAAVTPASGFVGPFAGLSIGIIAAIIGYSALHYLKTRTKIDDTLGVWPVHGIGGFIGVLLTGIFANVAINSTGNNGLLFGNPAQFGVQLLVVVMVSVYSFVVTFIIFRVLDRFIGVRVSPEVEREGLDLAESA